MNEKSSRPNTRSEVGHETDKHGGLMLRCGGRAAPLPPELVAATDSIGSEDFVVLEHPT
jgi:hypothetical protein